MKQSLLMVVAMMVAWGCASAPEPTVETLVAPAGTPPAAVRAMEEGNRLYTTKQWTEAKARYESAVQTAPSLAEAHYNLALTLDRLGDKQAAKKHYLQAANLAPGNKIIWNSWPLRKHGDVQVEPKGDTLLTPSKHAY